MSTPLFAPGISTQLPIHHMNSFNPSATPSSNHPTTTSHPSEPLTSKASSPPAPPTTSVNSNSTASPHSSRCSTSSSSADSLSPDSEALTCSSILGGGPGGRNSGDGGEGTGSVATTASPGSFVEAGSKGKGGVEEEVADEGGKLLERRESEGGPMEIAELSVRDESTPMVEDREGEDEEETTPEGSSSRDRLVVDGGNGGDGIAQTGAGGGKMRRASTLSSSSSSTQQTSPSGEENFQNGTTTTSSNSDWRPSGGKAGSDPSKPARRKAARLGSFEGKQREDEAMVDDDGEADNEAETPSTGKTEEKKAATTVPVASNSRPPSTVDKTPSARRPDPTPPQPPTPSSTKHVDIVSFPSAELLRLLASLLEQIAHANDALHQRSRSTSSSRPGSGTNTPALTGLTPSNTNGNNNEENEASFQSGRFVAAPLNSPVAPTSANRRGMSTVQDAEEGDESTTTQEEQEEMPVTPGVDLLREVGAAGGVEGFMPSLGGSHTPIPLGRRRGSSFMKRRDDSAPVLSRRSSAVPSGTATPSTPSTSNNNNTSSISTTSTSTNTSTTNPPQPSASSEPLTSLLTASSEALSGPAATLCFHARNVPAISIEAYLLRILKYCPTTNEVFLSLLVYFDRMARVGLEAQRMGLSGGGGGNGGGSPRGGSSGGGGGDGSRLFAIDSFNVHRLVIAGVTVASKFFSDVFYTNSRYAKVSSSLSLVSFHVVSQTADSRSSLPSLAGRWTPSTRTESTRTSIPSPQRLPTRNPPRRTPTLRRSTHPLLGRSKPLHRRFFPPPPCHQHHYRRCISFSSRHSCSRSSSNLFLLLSINPLHSHRSHLHLLRRLFLILNLLQPTSINSFTTFKLRNERNEYYHSWYTFYS